MSDFKAKMHRIRFPPGLRSRPRWRPTSKGREWEGREEEEPASPPIFWPRTAPGGSVPILREFVRIGVRGRTDDAHRTARR